MGDSHQWNSRRIGGGSITHAPTLSDEWRGYRRTSDMVPANNNTPAISSSARQYHSTRDMQVAAVRPASMHDLRCYSASYASYGLPPLDLQVAARPTSTKNGGGKGAYVPSSSYRAGGGSRRWVDPELQRRKRVAGYKAYGVEGKVKGSVKKGWRWVRERYKDIVHGWW